MSRYPALTQDDLERVARGIAAGRRQILVGEELGWPKDRVHRCLQRMRTQVAARLGDAWLNTREKSFVEVAQEWLRMQEQNPPAT